MTSTRTLCIAAPDFLQAGVVAPALEGLAEEAPGVRVAMVPPLDVWRGMEEDRIDLLLTSEGTTPETAIGRVLFNERFVLVQHKGHPRGTGPIDLDALCAAPHLLISFTEGTFRGVVDDTLADMGRTRRIASSVSGILLAPLVLTRIDHITMIPATVPRLFEHLLDAFDPPLTQPPLPVRLSRHPRQKAYPGLSLLQERFARLEGGRR